MPGDQTPEEQEAARRLAEELSHEGNGDQAIEPGEKEEGDGFIVVGVQVGMRRIPVKDDVESTTVNIGDLEMRAFRCELVVPGLTEEDEPEILDVLIPISQLELFVVRKARTLAERREDLRDAEQEAAEAAAGEDEEESGPEPSSHRH